MFLSIFSLFLPILSALSHKPLFFPFLKLGGSFAVFLKLALHLEWTALHAIINLLGISKDGKSITNIAIAIVC